MAASSVHQESSSENFFEQVPEPTNFSELIVSVKSFLEKSRRSNRTAALVTSGGTTVPLEQRAVRFVDNFSSGTRGAASAEYLLQRNYDVVFLYRSKSFTPYNRHAPNVLEILELDKHGNVKVKDDEKSRMQKLVRSYQANKEHLLFVPYETLGEYLWLLKGITQVLAGHKNRALLYLAAAVSDFYIPRQEMPEHKLKSNEKPEITFSLVPKMLKPLASTWAPEAFIISFKLETDQDLLIPKAKAALSTYNHKMVIANLLHTRKSTVTLVEKDGTITVLNRKGDDEIEVQIVNTVVEKHAIFYGAIQNDVKLR